jgi:hypothetical protein
MEREKKINVFIQPNAVDHVARVHYKEPTTQQERIIAETSKVVREAMEKHKVKMKKERIGTFSILSVRGWNGDGTVDGFWVQDKVGTLDEAWERANDYTISERNEYVVVGSLGSTTPALSYWQKQEGD